jgi:hypothetical protein
MRELAPGLWIVETPFRMYGFNLPQLGAEVGRRMTICRLEDGQLWIHSPAELTEELRGSLDALGQPRFVIAPNAFHGHRFMEQYREAYPAIELHAAPRLERRRKDLAFDGVLGNAPDPGWSAQLDQTLFAGHFYPEAVFLHRSSRTLIVGDLIAGTTLISSLSPASRLYWRLEGTGGSATTWRSYRIGVFNRRRARDALERILAWDFDRIITGHGEMIEHHGHAAFTRAMGWLRPSRGWARERHSQSAAP